MTNDEKDRHVLAAVHEPGTHHREHLEPWGVRVLHPQPFLTGIFRQEQPLVLEKLKQQAADRRIKPIGSRAADYSCVVPEGSVVYAGSFRLKSRFRKARITIER